MIDMQLLDGVLVALAILVGAAIAFGRDPGCGFRYQARPGIVWRNPT